MHSDVKIHILWYKIHHGFFKENLTGGQWWGKLDESNISYKNSSKDVTMNTSIVAHHI